MQEAKMLRNVVVYKMYMITKDPWFWGAILISSLMKLAHMSLREIYFMESVVMFGYVFFEIPSGAFADYVCRRFTIILGCLFLLIGMICFASMNSATGAWISNIIFMIGISLCSGADKALLSDTLAVLNKRSEIKKIQKQSLTVRLLIVAMGSLASGFFAEINLRLPLVLCIPNMLFCLTSVFFFTETTTTKRNTKKIEDFNSFVIGTYKAVRSMWRIVIKSLVHVKNNKKLKWIMFFFTLITVSSKLWFFTYNPYFELVGLDYEYYGYVFFTLNMVTAFFTHNSERIGVLFGEKNTLNILYILIGIPILFMATVVSKMSVSMIVLQNMVRGLAGLLYIEMIDKRLAPERKATILSISSAVSGLTEFVALAVFGAMIGFFGLQISLQVLGVCVVAIGVFYSIKYTEIF